MMILFGAAAVLACSGLLLACFAYVARRVNRLLGDLNRTGR